MVEQERGLEAEAGRLGEAVAEIDGHERIEAALLEGSVWLDGFVGREREGGADFTAHEIEQGSFTVGDGEGFESFDEGSGRVGISRGAMRWSKSYESAEQGVNDVRGAESGQIEGDGNEGGFGAQERDIEQGEAVLGGDVAQAGALQTREVGSGEVLGERARVGPVPPGEGGGGESARSTMMRDRVEERVGGGVVGLTCGAEDAGDGGEQDEGV